MTPDWPRPVVHWEIVARNTDVLAEFYRRLFNWHVGDGPIMEIPCGLGGPEPGPAGHMRQGDGSPVVLYVQVADLPESLTLVATLGGSVVAEPFDVPNGPTIAYIEDPEGNSFGLVQQ